MAGLLSECKLVSCLHWTRPFFRANHKQQTNNQINTNQIRSNACQLFLSSSSSPLPPISVSRDIRWQLSRGCRLVLADTSLQQLGSSQSSFMCNVTDTPHLAIRVESDGRKNAHSPCWLLYLGVKSVLVGCMPTGRVLRLSRMSRSCPSGWLWRASFDLVLQASKQLEQNKLSLVAIGSSLLSSEMRPPIDHPAHSIDCSIKWRTKYRSECSRRYGTSSLTCITREHRVSLEVVRQCVVMNLAAHSHADRANMQLGHLQNKPQTPEYHARRHHQ